MNLPKALDMRPAMRHLRVEIREPLGELDGLGALEGDYYPVGLGVPEEAGELGVEIG